MLIDFRELLSGLEVDETFEAHIDMNELNTGTNVYPIIQKSPFDITAHKTGKNKVNIQCEGTVTLEIPCDRCLEPVSTSIDFNVDDLVSFNGTSPDEEQEEKDYIDGYNLDVDRLIFGELLVSIPGKVLCSDDCKGLCPVCGNNLNVTECGCDRDVLDPRMSVFQDILKNFKEV
jgi:uncharacterized protein